MKDKKDKTKKYFEDRLDNKSIKKINNILSLDEKIKEDKKKNNNNKKNIFKNNKS